MAARQSTMTGARRGRKKQAAPRWLPSGTGAFFRHRLTELGGLLLIAGGLALALACATYSMADPSPNNATAGPIGNLLGRPGAYSADVLIQVLGLAVAAPVFALMFWGWRLLRRRVVPRWWLRLALLPLATAALAIALAGLPAPGSWPLASLEIGGAGIGGALGDLALERLSNLGATLWLSGLGAFLVGGALYSLSLGVTAEDVRRAKTGIGWLFDSGLVRLHAGLGAGLGARLRSGIARYREAAAATAGDSGIDAAGIDVAPGKRAKGKAAKGKLGLAGLGRAAGAVRREPRRGRKPASGAAAAGAKPTPAGEESLVASKAPPVSPGRKAREATQGKLDLDATAYELPPLLLLGMPEGAGRDSGVNRDALEKNARLLETVLDDFGVKGEIIKVRPGPVVTRYELDPAPGIKTSRVVGLADDIARSMSAVSVRVAVVPGSSSIGIELPNAKRETVYLRELLGSMGFERSAGKLPLVLGKDISGAPVMVDLARMPHLLIAGTTGSGKSVSVNVLILSLLYRLAPDRCKFIMIDPKMLELSVYDGIPHLLSPVVTEPKKAVVALKWTVREMEDRYRAMSRLGVRNLEGYNSRVEEARRSGEVLTRRVQTGFDPDTGQPVFEEQPLDLEPLAYIVVVVDEMADLMLVAGKEIEAAVQRLAQMARAAGIHLIMATQRPSVDVITGTIKANFPTRMSFHVTSKIDSRTILGEPGAEQLLGQGDMLYMAHGGKVTRVHGPLVTDEEVERIVGYLKQQGQPSYIEAVTEEEDGGFGDGSDQGGGSGDELYDRAIAVVLRHKKASTSFIQRHLQIGYNRAARLIERMEAEGVVSAANHVGKREILVQSPGDP